MKSNPPHKPLTKKKKILLWTLIPLGLIIIALALFLGMWFGCNKRKPGTSNPQKWLVIDGGVINADNGKYKVAMGTEIYYGPNDNNKMALGHDDLNVKAFSDDHGGVTDFCIKGEITFGFMVDPSMDFRLMCANNSSVKLSPTTNNNTVGIIVGQKDISFDGQYKGKMNIENNVNFNISSSKSYGVAGVLFDSTDSASKLIINGTWNIFASTTDGCWTCAIDCEGTAGGTLVVNGVWLISTIATMVAETYAYGVLIHTSDSNLQLAINGVWAISIDCPMAGGVLGIVFKEAANGTLNISGVWSISKNGETDIAPYGVLFEKGVNSNALSIGGIWAITSNKFAVFGIFFNSTVSGMLLINGMWMFSSSSGYGIDFNVDVSCSIETPNLQFFSKSSDMCASDFFDKLPGWHGSFEWNGETINSDNPNTSADTNLTYKQIYDQGNSQSTCNFYINAINSTTMPANKETFNNKLENVLDDYIESDDCPLVAEQWLRAIAEQIPSV